MIPSWSADELLRLAPLCANPPGWARALGAAAAVYDIRDSEDRLAMWTANVLHESQQLRHLEEDLSYSPSRLRDVWPKRFPSWDIARHFAGRPEALANYVYADRNGNGDEDSGDGWRFRGRGPLQLTGRTNYTRAGEALAQPLVLEPDLVLQPDIGALTAAWYWWQAGCHALADRGLFGDCVRAINGALTGIDDRSAYLIRARKVLASRKST